MSNVRVPRNDPVSHADPEDIVSLLAHALLYNGRKRTHDSSQLMAEMVARRLVEKLEQSNVVLMRGAPLGAHSAPMIGYPHVRQDEA